MRDSANSATHILVVDRCRDDADRLQTSLQQEGFSCEACTSAAAALTYARQSTPSLLIVDTRLDACSGFELVRSIGREHPGQEIPVIYFADAGGDDILQAARSAGGLYFLSKPIDPAVLSELVDKALWMPHLIRRHIDLVAHPAVPRPSRALTDKVAARAAVLNSAQ